VGIVDIDLLFQTPQEDARIIGGKGEEASSRGSTMCSRTLENCLERSPFIGK
jgi:hypothetical protein